MTLSLYFDQPSGLFEVVSFENKISQDEMDTLWAQIMVENAKIAHALTVGMDILNNDKEVQA